MRQWIRSALVPVMACRLFGAKPLLEPMLAYCLLDSWEQISMKFESEFYHFHSRKCNWNYRLLKGRLFCLGGDDLISVRVLKPEYSVRQTMSIAWLQMPWLLACRSSAIMVLTIQNTSAIVFYENAFQLTVTNHAEKWYEMQMYFNFLNECSTTRVYRVRRFWNRQMITGVWRHIFIAEKPTKYPNCFYYTWSMSEVIMTSWHAIAFPITDPLWGEFTDLEVQRCGVLMFSSLIAWVNGGQTFESSVIWDALAHMCSHRNNSQYSLSVLHPLIHLYISYSEKLSMIWFKSHIHIFELQSCIKTRRIWPWYQSVTGISAIWKI